MASVWLGLLLLISLWGFSVPVSLLRRLGEQVQKFQESSSLGLGLGPGPMALPKEGWLEQPLDPFNASDARTFLQRYWVNDQHWTSPDGPVFLHLGGEGSLGPGSVTRGHPAALAPAWGALVIGLEHRFYGLSVPPGGLEMAQLQFLSSRHALADVVSARLALPRLLNISASSPWICFGGSYAGSLAAWARLKFPHLLFAAVASSAPVLAVLDFSGYNDVVSRSLLNPEIGGSPECRAAVSAAFEEAQRRLRAGGTARARLRTELGACGHLDGAEDQAELLEALQALVGGAVQYDGQAGAPLSVRQLCGLLVPEPGNCSRSAPYGGLRRAAKVVMHSLGQRCLSSPRAETVAQLRNTEPQMSGIGDRQWLYQTCTEFGFYVTCEGPQCPFSRLPALPSHLALCEEVFGLALSSIAQAVAQTNAYYGGLTPGATRVLFVNGDTDPWHVLSVTQNLGPSETALLIPNSSHCLDMAPERPSDSPSLRRGRQAIAQQLQTWLRLAKESQPLHTFGVGELQEVEAAAPPPADPGFPQNTAALSSPLHPETATAGLEVRADLRPGRNVDLLVSPAPAAHKGAAAAESGVGRGTGSRSRRTQDQPSGLGGSKFVGAFHCISSSGPRDRRENAPRSTGSRLPPGLA
ncbi:thymus-specific serine protease [Suncus etruscus]|uniref:thymus-specific serine protease n=1 Tax=Suncus etruscus TaxID=109475 RepID=UPI00210F2BEA|nr:thymus-specific serine protease [Suncus etruscus]